MKKKGIFAIIGIVIILIGFILLAVFEKPIKAFLSKNKESAYLSPVGSEEIIEEESPDIYGDDVLDADLTEWKSQYRVSLRNRTYLLDSGLPEKGIANFDSALSKYLDEVSPDSGNHYVDALENYFYDKPTWCAFNVYIEDLDMTIHCIYTKGDVSGYNFR